MASGCLSTAKCRRPLNSKLSTCMTIAYRLDSWVLLGYVCIVALYVGMITVVDNLDC